MSERRPLLIDRYLTDAIEVDVDCLADGKDTYIAGIMEHIEEAGIHSGDSACSLPPHNLSAETIAELDRQTRALALALKVGGLMNVQYAIKDGDIYVLEVNPRASRTVPFVAKVIGVPVAKIAARIMAGETLESFRAEAAELRVRHRPPRRREGSGVSVRALRRQGRHRARPGDEIDRRGHGHRPRLQCRLRQKPARRRHRGCRKAEPCSSRSGTPTSRASSTPSACSPGSVFGCWRPREPSAISPGEGVAAVKINKVAEGRPHIVDAIKNGEVQLVFNTTEGATALADSRSLRRAALLHKVPYYTTLSGAVAAAQGIKAYLGGDLEVCALQNYFAAASDPEIGPARATARVETGFWSRGRTMLRPAT